ncbi:MAG: hypothetical protein D6761_04450 [Candidatus Dadabacteria bacterium]|nr:MAG: hypothetical protein D6761_04450 [Candidatus Dadabacteria bacterium]
MRCLFAAVLLAAIATPALANDAVTSLTTSVSGPGWTRDRVLQRGISLSAGDPFDARRLWEDLARLRNSELFQTVTATVSKTSDGVALAVTATDRFSLIPVFEPTFGGDVFQVTAGLRDANFLGLAQDMTLYGGLFARGDVRGPIVGGQWIHRQIAGRHTLAVIADLSQTDALFFDAAGRTVESYDVRSASGLLQGILKSKRGLEPGAYTGWSGRWADAVIPSTTGTAAVPAVRQDILLGMTLRLGSVDYDAFLYNGCDVVFDLVQRIRVRGGRGYPALTVQGRAFNRPLPWLNLAARVRIAGRLNEQRADDLAWGGFSEVRGIASGRLRGRLGALVNAEARATIARRLWNTFFIQTAVFCDGAATRRSLRGSRAADAAGSCGLGFRGSIHQLAGVFGRIDLAFAIDSAGVHPGINFGVRQFF